MELTAVVELPHRTGPTLTPAAPIEISGLEMEPIGIVHPWIMSPCLRGHVDVEQVEYCSSLHLTF